MARAEPWLDDEEQQMWRHWTALNAELTAALQRDLHSDGPLSLPDFQVLAVLSESPEGERRVSELASLLQWEQSRLSHQVRRMESRELVARASCADDGRGAVVRITDEGRAAITAAAPGHARAVRRLFLDALEPAEVRQLGAVFERLRAQVAAPTPSAESSPPQSGRR